MSFEDILTLIGNYAFPICCCIYLFWSSSKERDAHQEEMHQMTEALNNNTIALTELRDLVKNGNH